MGKQNKAEKIKIEMPSLALSIDVVTFSGSCPSDRYRPEL